MIRLPLLLLCLAGIAAGSVRKLAGINGYISDHPDERCDKIGEFLLHPFNRCSYLVCDYGHEPWKDEYGKTKYYARIMKCASGTAVPKSAYNEGTQKLNPHKVCTEHYSGPCPARVQSLSGNFFGGARYTPRHNSDRDSSFGRGSSSFGSSSSYDRRPSYSYSKIVYPSDRHGTSKRPSRPSSYRPSYEPNYGSGYGLRRNGYQNSHGYSRGDSFRRGSRKNSGYRGNFYKRSFNRGSYIYPKSYKDDKNPGQHYKPSRDYEEEGPTTYEKMIYRKQEQSYERPTYSSPKKQSYRSRSTASSYIPQKRTSYRQPSHSERPSYKVRSGYSDRASYNEKPSYSKRTPYSERLSYSERPSYSKRSSYSETPSYSKRSSYKDPPSKAPHRRTESHAPTYASRQQSYSPDSSYSPEKPSYRPPRSSYKPSKPSYEPPSSSYETANAFEKPTDVSYPKPPSDIKYPDPPNNLDYPTAPKFSSNGFHPRGFTGQNTRPNTGGYNQQKPEGFGLKNRYTGMHRIYPRKANINSQMNQYKTPNNQYRSPPKQYNPQKPQYHPPKNQGPPNPPVQSQFSPNQYNTMPHSNFQPRQNQLPARPNQYQPPKQNQFQPHQQNQYQRSHPNQYNNPPQIQYQRPPKNQFQKPPHRPYQQPLQNTYQQLPPNLNQQPPQNTYQQPPQNQLHNPNQGQYVRVRA